MVESAQPPGKSDKDQNPEGRDYFDGDAELRRLLGLRGSGGSRGGPSVVDWGELTEEEVAKLTPKTSEGSSNGGSGTP